MTQAVFWAVIIGMALVNFSLRFVPLAVLSRISLPDWLKRWLSYIPVSVMATLVAGEVFRPDGIWIDGVLDPHLLAAIATGLVYQRTRSFAGATVAGIVAFLALGTVLG